MKEIDRTIRSVQNRINESRNNQGKAVTISLSTLKEILDICLRAREMREARDEPVPMNHSFGFDYCPSCGIMIETWKSHNYCPRCGQAIKGRKVM